MIHAANADAFVADQRRCPRHPADLRQHLRPAEQRRQKGRTARRKERALPPAELLALAQIADNGS